MQDTQADDPLLQDEEIDYLLTVHSSPITAAITGLERLIVRYSREPDIRMGQTWLYDSDRVGMMKDALAILVGNRHAGPYSGGLLQSEFDALDTEEEPDLVPVFRRDPSWTRSE